MLDLPGAFGLPLERLFGAVDIWIGHPVSRRLASNLNIITKVDGRGVATLRRLSRNVVR